MKKLLLLLATVGMMFTACGPDGGLDDNDSGNNGTQPVQPGGGNQGGNDTPKDAYITLNKEAVNLSPDGESVDIKVYSNYEWTLTNNCDWVTTSVSGGKANEGGTTITLSANLSYDNREGTIVFNCGKAKKALVVSQSLKEVIIPDEKNTFNVPAEGGTVKLAYQTSVECKVIIPEEAQSWISLASGGTRALVSESAVLNIAENNTGVERSAVVKVVKVGGNTPSAEYTITQERNIDAYIALNKEVVNLSPDGESVDIKVYSNYEWTLTNNCDWVTTSVSGGKASEEGTTITLSADLSYDNREGTIVFNCGKAKKALVVSQSLKEVIIPDEKNTFNVPAEGGAVELAYQTSVECKVIIPEGAQSWISLASGGTRALVSESTVLNVAENNTGVERSAVVKVVKVGGNTPSAEYTITQECNVDAYITLSKEVVNLSPDGESVDIKVYSNYEWTLTNNCDWVTTSVSGGGASEEGATITLSADLSYDNREGTIVFNCGKAKKVLVVSQSLKEVIIPDEKNTFNVPAEGGAVELAYQTSVECKVIIPEGAQSWISLASGGTRALVSESTVLNVAENNTGVERSAVVKVVKVGDNTPSAEYTITQERNMDYVFLYTTTDGFPITIEEFGYLTNTYEDGVGMLAFDGSKIAGIVDWVFYNCDSLTSITIPNGITWIAHGAFYGCSSLTSITISDSVTSISEYAFWECTSLTSIAIPDSVTSIESVAFANCTSLTSVTIGDGDTSIGNEAFVGCTSLTSVTIGNGVVTIGDNAFNACPSLTNLTILDSDISIGRYVFSGCTSLASVTIGNGDTTIGYLAFDGCTSLTSVTIGNGVTSIRYRAFYNCTSLTSVTIGSGDTSIEGEAFYNCASLTSITIPDSVTSIEARTFYNCAALTSITIPDGVTSIGDQAFWSCASLTSITIPDSVTTLGDQAFWECTSLTSATIGNGVTSIGEEVFIGCTSLKSVTIPDGVTSIGYAAFKYCTSLTSVTIPDSVTSIGSWAFYNCSSLTSVTIPDSVTTIGDGAFCDCASLTSITIPDSVTTLGDQTFGYCTSLTSVTIPDSVTSIGEFAFESCTKLTSVTIGNGVTSIVESVFSSCTSLKEIYCKPTTPPVLGSYAFGYYKVKDRKIYVPTASVEAYKTAPMWTHYVDDIVGWNF